MKRAFVPHHWMRSLTQQFARVWLGAGYLFLYLPIAALVLFSFNDSPVPTLWRGLTLRWYAKLAGDGEMLAALGLSIKLALLSASGSVLLGLLAAYALVKYPRFRGRALFAGMVNAPLVMPEVIVGLALLLLLVGMQGALGFPSRGLGTLLIGHNLLGMAYATVVLQARLRELPPALEEAALDLGARPQQVFRLVTLPMMLQALGSAWLLTFSLSLDDVVASAFLSGPGSTTLPLVIFSRARMGVDPSVNAMATLIIVAVVSCITAASLWAVHAERRRQREMCAAWSGKT